MLQHDTIPLGLRIQIRHMWEEWPGRSFGAYPTNAGNPQRWQGIERTIAKEHKISRLGMANDAFGRCAEYLVTSHTSTAHVLDLIEHVCRVTSNELGLAVALQRTKRSLEELNARFAENGVGYKYDRDTKQIVRIDSPLLNAEVVEPALRLLHEHAFAGAEAEMIEAFKHFRHRDIDPALTEAGKAVESTIKSIAKLQGWDGELKGDETLGQLTSFILKKELAPSWLQPHFAGLANAIGGVGNVRNKYGPHGDGHEVREVPEHFAAYAIHLAASNIVFLVECHKAKK